MPAMQRHARSRRSIVDVSRAAAIAAAAAAGRRIAGGQPGAACVGRRPGRGTRAILRRTPADRPKWRECAPNCATRPHGWPQSREREAPLNQRAANWSHGSVTTCAPRWPGCVRWPKRSRTASSRTPSSYYKQIIAAVDRLNRRWSRTCSTCRGSSPAAWPRDGADRARRPGVGLRRRAGAAGRGAGGPAGGPRRRRPSGVTRQRAGTQPGADQPRRQRDPAHPLRRHGRRAGVQRRPRGGGGRARRVRRHPGGAAGPGVRRRVPRRGRPHARDRSTRPAPGWGWPSPAASSRRTTGRCTWRTGRTDASSASRCPPLSRCCYTRTPTAVHSSRTPTWKSTWGAQPSSRAMRDESAVMCRTSPSR